MAARLSDRQKKILISILDRKSFVSFCSISKDYDVSIRMARYDIDSINFYLENSGAGYINIKNGLIDVCIRSGGKIKNIINNISGSIDMNEGFMASIIILTNEKVTLDEIAVSLKISRSKAKKLMKNVLSIFDQMCISVISKRSFGVMIDGDEDRIRRALMNFLEIDRGKYIEFIFRRIRENSINLAKKFIYKYQIYKNVILSDDSFREIIIFIGYQIYRISIQKNVYYYDGIFCERDERFITDFFRQNEVVFSKDESCFLMRQLKQITIIEFSNEYRNNIIIDEIIVSCIDLFINKIRSYIRFYGGDENEKKLCDGLRLHLISSVNRIRNGYIIVNPLKESARFKFKVFFEVVKEELIIIEEGLGITFPDDEIAYVTMYVEAMREYENVKKKRLNVLVICASGLATSMLLKSRIQKFFPDINVSGPLAQSALTQDVLDKTDFIVSTIALNNVDKECFIVSPFMDEDEFFRLKKYFIGYFNKYEIINFYKNDEFGELFSSLISKDLIVLDSDLYLWREVIVKAAMPLISQKKIESCYVDAIIKAIEEYGAYMVFIPRIAIVHSSPDNGVNCDAISIVRVKEEILFCDRDAVPVKVFIFLASIKGKESLFMRLIRFLSVDRNISVLFNSSDPDDILNMKSGSGL